MVIDKENRIVSMNGIVVDLTGKEFDLLFFLASNKGRYKETDLHAGMGRRIRI